LGEAQGWLVEYVPLNEIPAMLLRLVQENERLQQELAAARMPAPFGHLAAIQGSR
jgi:hypothetical protein